MNEETKSVDSAKGSTMAKSEELEMHFDPNTIEHLGIQMYSTLPPVIAELVSNAYDADAKYVCIKLKDMGDKAIVISDNGHGMKYSDLNSKFLKIGRDRRSEVGQKSESGERYVIGKKGIGKLSFFGIAHHIEVTTIRDGLKNIFILDWEKIKEAGKAGKNYKPDTIIIDEPTDDPNGTRFELTQIKRTTGFSPDDIAYSLAKEMSVFDEKDFKVEIFHNGEIDPIKVANELRYKDIDVEYSWNFPKKIEGLKYAYEDQIEGRLIASKNVLTSKMNGVALFSRGKLVNDYSFLEVKASSHDYKYITGWLDIGFIDMWDMEVISTNRRSLNWEFEETIALKKYLEQAYRFFFNEVKEVKQKNKIKAVEEQTGVSIENWMQDLPGHERSLASKIVNNIVSHGGIETEKAGELISFVKDSFQFEAFKEMARDIDESSFSSPEKIIELFKEWKIIESRELYKLALGRIQTIEKFERYIKEHVREVPTMHNFLKQFSWLLDPRIIEFKDEVYYSKLLKDKFDDSTEDMEENKRIDFLCTGLGNSFFIIELKKPEYKIKEKDILQARDYLEFIKEHFGTTPYSYHQIVAYVVTGKFNNDTKVSSLLDAFGSQGTIYLKTYHELLTNAKDYHKEFIERYNELIKKG
jgi:hypothetical protein